jgi:hypothetical protein
MGLENDHLYEGEILAAQEVIRNSDSHHKSLFFNINGEGHRDQRGIEKLLWIFCHVRADS